MTSFRFTPYCGCSGAVIPSCILVADGINGGYTLNTTLTSLRRSLDNEEGFHKGFRIINGNEVVPVTAEQSNVPYANLLAWIDCYRDGRFIHRVFYEDSSKTFYEWFLTVTQKETSNNYWHVSDGANESDNTTRVVFRRDRLEPDFFRVFVSQFDYASYPLNFVYDGTASGYRNAPHIFLPQVDDPKDYYLICNYTHLPNCGEGTHTVYRTGTDTNPYIMAGSVYQQWLTRRYEMHWGTSKEFIGFYGLTTTTATFDSSTPTNDELTGRVARCQHIDGVADEMEARWNHDIIDAMANCQHWLFPEYGHMLARSMSYNDTAAQHNGYKDAQDRRYRTWAIQLDRLPGYGGLARHWYPGSMDDETISPYRTDGWGYEALRGRCYVYGRSQLCSPFDTTFHHYSGFMFPLGRYEIIQTNNAPTIDSHGFSHRLYEMKLKKRVYDFTADDFARIKLNMFGSQDYYTEFISSAPFNHQDFINGFSVVAYPETHLFTDPNDVLPNYKKTQGHLIGTTFSRIIMNWGASDKNFGIVQREVTDDSTTTVTPISVGNAYWMMDCTIPDGGFIDSYDQGYYSSFDLTDYCTYGTILPVPDFRDFIFSDGTTKIKIPDIPDTVYDTFLPGDTYFAVEGNSIPSGPLFVYPMVYISGYTIENNE